MRVLFLAYRQQPAGCVLTQGRVREREREGEMEGENQSELFVAQSLCQVRFYVTPQRLQHARLPCPSPSPKDSSNTCPLSRCCYLSISSSATFLSFGTPSFPASGSFPVSQLFASGGQSVGASASASVLPVNIQG